MRTEIAGPGYSSRAQRTFTLTGRVLDAMHINGPLYLLHQGGVVKFGMRVQERHINPMGNLHGGMMASFADMLLPCAPMYQGTGERRFLPTISLQIDYLAPSPLGAWVEGEAQVLRTTRTMVFAQGLVTADGVPVARTSGVMKIGPLFDLKSGEDAG